MTEFIIPYPSTKAGKSEWNKRYGLNAYYSGKHYAVRKKDADYWHTMTMAELRRQKIKKAPCESPVIITMYFNDNMDCSNHAVIFKMIEDSIKGIIIKDDNRKCVVGNEIYFHDKDYIRVVIRKKENPLG